MTIPADFALLLIGVANYIHNALDEGVETCQQGRIAVLPSADLLSNVLDHGLVEETGSVIRNEKFGCLIHPKPWKDFVHVEGLVASARLYIKDLILTYSYALRLQLKLLILSDLGSAHGHYPKRVVERHLARRTRDAGWCFRISFFNVAISFHARRRPHGRGSGPQWPGLDRAGLDGLRPGHGPEPAFTAVAGRGRAGPGRPAVRAPGGAAREGRGGGLRELGVRGGVIVDRHVTSRPASAVPVLPHGPSGLPPPRPFSFTTPHSIAQHVKDPVESTNEGCNNSIVVTNTWPQPNYLVGFGQTECTLQTSSLTSLNLLSASCIMIFTSRPRSIADLFTVRSQVRRCSTRHR